jgi:uncharacterized protein with PQ loop repeat
MEILRWIFIVIGFVGAILTIFISIINWLNIHKTKVPNTTLWIQYIILFSNVAMFVYGFGLSIINLHKPIFYNSMPTWVGNGIALIVNSIITILIHKHKFKQKHH